MLLCRASKHLRPRRCILQQFPSKNTHLTPRNHARTFISLPTLQTLTDGFLDLSLALPYPPGVPPYATTIVLATVLSRIALTLPFSIWAKKRQWRMEEEAIPKLLEYRNQAARSVALEMKNERFRGNIDVFKQEHGSRLRKLLSARQKALFSEYRCNPTPTLAIPMFTQLPIFVASTMFFSHLSTPAVASPSGLTDESFLTLTSLAHPDATATLPIVLGLVTLANVETSHWFMGAGRASREASADARRKEERKKIIEENEKAPAGQKTRLPLPSTREIIQNALRLFSIARIVIGVMVDGTVIVYWVTSATFGLLQTWAFNSWDARLEGRRRAGSRTLPPNNTTALEATRPSK
ncbi:hypothetical protein SCHPADRAFT_820380 [Schizopora paradoxa]|uniref:Membrane insertase YidC/Oxa/ALB C-terminal domain-containing protein n=1 Tax=Schizopora paradoxa TaxID=27342 RepID=A0A0H2S125_9AGAM|nr:hypothetical protein SCHPADRAFT_820380 [Schizopora paradoxa]